MINNILEELQLWYQNQCDGNWEHNNVIKIETLDNPGWHITIDLEDTSLEGLAPFQIDEELSDENWYSIALKHKKYIASGDPTKLEMLIAHFIKLANADD